MRSVTISHPEHLRLVVSERMNPRGVRVVDIDVYDAESCSDNREFRANGQGDFDVPDPGKFDDESLRNKLAVPDDERVADVDIDLRFFHGHAFPNDE